MAENNLQNLHYPHVYESLALSVNISATKSAYGCACAHFHLYQTPASIKTVGYFKCPSSNKTLKTLLSHLSLHFLSALKYLQSQIALHFLRVPLLSKHQQMCTVKECCNFLSALKYLQSQVTLYYCESPSSFLLEGGGT